MIQGTLGIPRERSRNSIEERMNIVCMNWGASENPVGRWGLYGGEQYV